MKGNEALMKIKAFAKINLSLDITGKRPDGYHLLDTVMQSVSLCDEIEIEKAESISVTCDIDEIGGEQNIVSVAAAKFFELCGICGGCRISVRKNIPICAGLGGGSADAAAVICALDQLYGTNLSRESLIKLAESVGADVPFCLFGGTCRVTGIGEKIERICDIPKTYFVITKQGKKNSTAEMFKAIDSKEHTALITEKLVYAIKGNDNNIYKYIANTFESLYDTDYEKGLFADFKPLAICLSGSGPSVYAVFSQEDAAKLCADTLNSKNIKAYFCENVSKGFEIE